MDNISAAGTTYGAWIEYYLYTSNRKNDNCKQDNSREFNHDGHESFNADATNCYNNCN